MELRFARIVFGVSSSPFLLNATIRHHLEHVGAEPTIIKKLMRAFYVDDVSGASNEDEAFSLYQNSKAELMSHPKGGEGAYNCNLSEHKVRGCGHRR